MNNHLGTVIVMPMTSGSHSEPFRLGTRFKAKPGLLLGDQIRSVSKRRLVKKLSVVDFAMIEAALKVLREMFEE